jgi:YD repeat-containing protein
VDANGHKTESTYDALGRRTQVWLPDHTRTAYPNVPSAAYAYTISISAPNVIATTGLTAAGGQVTSYTLYDGLLRPRQPRHRPRAVGAS